MYLSIPINAYFFNGVILLIIVAELPTQIAKINSEKEFFKTSAKIIFTQLLHREEMGSVFSVDFLNS